LSIRCYYTKQVDDPNFVESKLHEAFDKFGMQDNRKFFIDIGQNQKDV